MIMIQDRRQELAGGREEKMSDRPKLIYLARRHGSIAVDRFTPRWRQHGRLGMSLPRWRNIWRYAQCDALPWPAAPLPLAADYDGVGLVWYRSLAARVAHVDDGDRAIMASDELETFDRPVRERSFVASERVFRPAPPDAVKLFCFLFARRDVAPDEVARDLAETRAQLLSRALRDGGSGAGYTINLPRLDGALPPGSGLSCIA